MTYEISLNETNIELPNYSMKIAEKIENVDKQYVSSAKTYIDKIKLIYKFLIDLLGKEEVEEIIGTLEECDPNLVHLCYLRIVRAYNSPITEEEKMLERQSLEDYGQLHDLVSGINKLPATTEKITKMKR